MSWDASAGCPLGRLPRVRFWAVRGVELPFGDRARSGWVGESGTIHDEPIGETEALPGRYVLSGLVDAHTHPAVSGGPDGPVALAADATRATLLAWAESGITLVRDVGSPAAVTLSIEAGPRQPLVRAAGRFLAHGTGTSRSCWSSRSATTS